MVVVGVDWVVRVEALGVTRANSGYRAGCTVAVAAGNNVVFVVAAAYTPIVVVAAAVVLQTAAGSIAVDVAAAVVGT